MKGTFLRDAAWPGTHRWSSTLVLSGQAIRPVYESDDVQAGLSESLEVDGLVVKVSGQSRDILFKKCHL